MGVASEALAPDEGVPAAVEAGDEDDVLLPLTEEQAIGEAPQTRAADVPQNGWKLAGIVEDAADLPIDLCAES